MDRGSLGEQNMIIGTFLETNKEVYYSKEHNAIDTLLGTASANYDITMKIVTLETNKPVEMYGHSVLSLVGYAVLLRRENYYFSHREGLQDYELVEYYQITSIYDAHIVKWKTYE